MWIRTKNGRRINANYLISYCAKDQGDCFGIITYDVTNDLIWLGEYKTRERADRALEGLDYAIVHEPNMYTMLEDAED